ncbi:MAG: hypothetical protein Q4F39_01560 [Bacteroidia bacterium]|nr:hypothetical protein [Bacteroidia bacterium]
MHYIHCNAKSIISVLLALTLGAGSSAFAQDVYWVLDNVSGGEVNISDIKNPPSDILMTVDEGDDRIFSSLYDISISRPPYSIKYGDENSLSFDLFLSGLELNHTPSTPNASISVVVKDTDLDHTRSLQLDTRYSNGEKYGLVAYWYTPPMYDSATGIDVSWGFENTSKFSACPTFELVITLGVAFDSQFYNTNNGSKYLSPQYYITYTYKCVTGDIEETANVIDTWADENSGENGWVVPALVIGGITVLLLSTKKRKKKEPEKEKEDDEDSYKYELRISKRFGDTIICGDAPQGIYAYIVRIDRYGTEKTDEALTRMIKIKGDGFLEVTGLAYQEGTQSANVSAPALDEDSSVPEDGIVTFTISTAHGSFSNRMHFKIASPQIVFLHDELVIPSNCEKTIYLPFEVNGLGDNPQVELSMSDDCYSVSLDVDKKADLYYALISENKEKRRRQPDVPGEKSRHNLIVTAKNAAGNIRRKELPVIRFTMGLACPDLNHIDCFAEEYDPVKHMVRGLTVEGRIDRATDIHSEPVWEKVKLSPAETEFRLTLYDYDEENRSILALPAAIKNYKVEADGLAAEEYLPKRAAGSFSFGADILNTIPGMGAVSGLLRNTGSLLAKYRSPAELAQETVNNLGIQIGYAEPVCKDDPDNGCMLYRFVCTKGILHKPNKIKAIVTIEVEYQGRTYTLEKKVTLRSMPRRTELDYNEKAQLLKRDQIAIKGLKEIDSNIFQFHYWRDLDYLQALIEDIVENYDQEYGVDWQQARAIFRIYNSFLESRMDEANSAADQSAYLSDTVDRTLKMGKWAEEKMGVWGRIAAGVATFGITEGVFNSLEVLENMKSYVDNGGNNVFVGFCLGSWVPVREYLWGLAFDESIPALKKYFAARKAGKKIAEETTAAAAEAAAKKAAEKATGKAVKESAEEGVEKACHIGNRAEMAAAADKTAETLAKESSEQAATMARNASANASVSVYSKLIETEISALEKASAELDNWAKAIKDCGGAHSEEMMLKAIKLQQNKHVLELLQFGNRPDLDLLRKVFNQEMDYLHNRLNTELAHRLCEKYPYITGGNMGSIKLLKITSSDKALLKAGKKITFDFDGTYYIIAPDGSHHFFTQNEINDIYAETLYEIYHGKGGTAEECITFMKKCDQTIIQADYVADSYGLANARIMTNSRKMAVALPDPELAGETSMNKCLEWWVEGKILLGSADREMQEAGVGYMREAFRQCYKQFYNFTTKRNAARLFINGKSCIPDRIFTIMKILKQTDVAPSGSLKVGEAMYILDKMGTTPEDIFRCLKEMTINIG